MKFKNKIIVVLVLLLSLITLHSCTSSTSTTQLDTPTLTLKNSQISWNLVDNADEYVIYINGTVYQTVQTNIYNLNLTSEGSYTIQIQATSNEQEYTKSELSNKCIYVVNSSESQKLAAPVISLNLNVITWDKVKDANGYTIYINDQKVCNTLYTYYTLIDYPVGTYRIKIIAYSSTGNKLDSDFSNEVVYTKSTEYLKISEVKQLIDLNPDGCDVKFVGKVIGYDSMGYAHVADETGAIYVRAKSANLMLGYNVEIKGFGFVYTGSRSRPEYTRQIMSDGIEINLYGGSIENVYNYINLTEEDLENKELSAGFHGNLVEVTGIIECSESKYDFYLNDLEGNHILSIHHYSLNFNNDINNPSNNKFLELDGKLVTLKGVIYRYNYYNDIWTIQCIGLDDDIKVLSNKLDTPVIQDVDQLIEWEYIDNADKYEIYVDDEFYDETTTNYFDYSILDNDPHYIKIKAVSASDDYLDSSFSNKILINSVNQTDEVNLFMINDTHGSIFDSATPGISRVAELIAQLEDSYSDIIKVANGDIFQGSYESNTLRGRVLVESFNYLDFDCFVLGNHEFDWGLDEIKKYKDGILENGEADFPFLGANIIDKTTNSMVDWLEPYTIIEYGDIEVGVIGVIGSSQESSILSTMVANYEFVDPLQIIKNLTAELRNDKGCEVVVVASHDYDDQLNYNLSRLSGDYRIDTILCAHTHQEIYEELTRPDNISIPVVQNRDKNQSASFLTLNLDSNLSLESYDYKRYYVSNYQQNEEFNQFLLQYQYLNDESNRVIGYNSYGFNKSFLGTLSTNKMKDKYTADVAIMNTGGIRATISSGDVTIGDVFQVLPFDNEVIITYLTGSQIKSLYENNASYLYFNSGFDSSSFVNTKTYKVAVIDYVYYGTYYSEFKGTTCENTHVTLRDLLIEYIDENY